MYPNELIGKNAIRTKPVTHSEASEETNMFGQVITKQAVIDNSYTDSPLYILAATESHIIVKYVDREAKIFGDKPRVLNFKWVDNNWTDYDELMKLAEEQNIKLLQMAHQAINESKSI